MPLVLAAYPLSAVAFLAAGTEAAAIMLMMGFVGLLAIAAAGLPARVVVPLGLGLLAVLWIVWIEPPGGPRTTSAFAHGTAGALLGWALAESARRREPWPRWGLTALLGVLAIGIGWELCERAADSVFDTFLQLSAGDSALDLSANLVGAALAVVVLRSHLTPQRAP
jgi:hypothetical protein